MSCSVRDEGEHGHDLRGGRDVEPRLARRAVLASTEAAHDVAQRAVVHVEDALPRDAVGVEVELVAVVEVVVDHGGEEVVGRRHRVQVAREVQVEVLEGDDLAVPAAGGAALDAERGAHGGLADGDGRLAPDAGQGLAETHRGRRLALAERRRCHRRHHDVARAWAGGPAPRPRRGSPWPRASRTARAARVRGPSARRCR